MAYGLGVLRGMMITLNRIIRTYQSDLEHPFKRYDPVSFAKRQSVRGRGIITVQYPEEKMPVPENFRFTPFLVYDPVLDEHGNAVLDSATGKPKVGVEKCTACGICSKVCPPQCIWIVRATTPEGKPKPKPAEFYIDIDICMNCGFCAEYCPFDAIKMDHDYEMANYERLTSHIHDIDRLMKPTPYHAQIHPADWAREDTDRKAKEAAKAKKQ